jgi:hypothetical protein
VVCERNNVEKTQVEQIGLFNRIASMPIQQYHAVMFECTDLFTASKVDMTLILLPAIGRWETSWMLAASGVPLEVASRVMAVPVERRRAGNCGGFVRASRP